jgi:hypothetical protein
MAKVQPLFADAHTVNARPHSAMVARTAVDIEGTGVPDRSIGVKRILVGLPIVSIPRKQPSGANPKYVAPGLDAFAARRAVGAVRARHGWRARECQDQSQSRNPASHGDLKHLLGMMGRGQLRRPVASYRYFVPAIPPWVAEANMCPQTDPGPEWRREHLRGGKAVRRSDNCGGCAILISIPCRNSWR